MHKLHVCYFGPDRSVPQSEILRGSNAVNHEGLFEQRGITMLPAWKVAQICEQCDREAWIKPSVYQGKYNALHCTVEPELFPCLRHYGIKSHTFNSVAGGFLASGDSHKRKYNGSHGNTEHSSAMELPHRSLGIVT